MADETSEVEEVDEVDDHQSWDDFWAEVVPDERTETIRGVIIKVPHRLPLKFDRRATQLKNSGDEEAIGELLTMLFGVNVLDAWVDADMDDLELKVALMWGMAHGKGRAISFRRAYELVMEQEAAKAQDQAEGKAPASARSSTRKRSASGSTGGRSKRTSDANIGSPPAKSRS